MAERRMFAKTIIDSDNFLDLPLSSQALYFQLGMRADDDGFINNPKRIQRMIGATEDDLKLLIDKKFIILFESGVVVIKHWKMNNYIQKDRYKETVYLEEKSMLNIKENNAYKLSINNKCIQDGYKMDTQDRIGKDSIGYIYTAYEENINQLSPTQYEKLNKWLELFSEDIIKIAIDKTSNSNKKSFNYFEGILKSWKAKGIKTIQEVLNERKSSKNEVETPKWMNTTIEAEEMTPDDLQELDEMIRMVK